MAIVIAQLSDIHVRAADDRIFSRATQLADAILAEANQSASDIVLLVTGDSANTGSAAEFALAQQLITSVQTRIKDKSPSTAVHIIAIPGNHDCDLSGDQALRDLALRNLSSTDIPASSVAEIALKPLAAYFAFSEALVGTANSLTVTRPYYHAVDVTDSSGRILRFHLLNSAWMSSRHEQPGSLTFPLAAIEPAALTEPRFAIAVLHHPFNWFRQPEAMRPLEQSLEGLSDLVLTGHEHSPAAFQKTAPGKATHGYIAGGALAEVKDATVSAFNVIRLDFDAESQVISTYSWVPAGYYKYLDDPVTQVLGTNLGRIDRKFTLTRVFEEITS